LERTAAAEGERTQIRKEELRLAPGARWGQNQVSRLYAWKKGQKGFGKNLEARAPNARGCPCNIRKALMIKEEGTQGQKGTKGPREGL
jgi:hypothetical protein